jgi:hypothetical protein
LAFDCQLGFGCGQMLVERCRPIGFAILGDGLRAIELDKDDAVIVRLFAERVVKQVPDTRRLAALSGSARR